MKHDLSMEVQQAAWRKPGRFSSAAAVLVSGLALSGCKDDPAANTERTCKMAMSTVPSVNLISYQKGKCTVREGDTLLNIEFMGENAGFFGWEVSKLDAKGIELGMDMEIFMSEHASDKGAPLRINYGETKPLVVGEFALTQTLARITVEKGTMPGTAVVEVVPEVSK